jgi:hypothetical protein
MTRELVRYEYGLPRRVRCKAAGTCRWTVTGPIPGKDPVTGVRDSFTWNSTRMPVDDAAADQAVETNQTVTVKLAAGRPRCCPTTPIKESG